MFFFCFGHFLFRLLSRFTSFLFVLIFLLKIFGNGTQHKTFKIKTKDEVTFFLLWKYIKWFHCIALTETAIHHHTHAIDLSYLSLDFLYGDSFCFLFFSFFLNKKLIDWLIEWDPQLCPSWFCVYSNIENWYIFIKWHLTLPLWTKTEYFFPASFYIVNHFYLKCMSCDYWNGGWKITHLLFKNVI